MANLERLGLGRTPVSDEVIQELKTSPSLPRLRHVGFYPSWIKNATEQEISEHFRPLHGATLAERLGDKSP
jgi:hypothetical protein